jgi:N-dimethylarginine dimethylaminohydrolase
MYQYQSMPSMYIAPAYQHHPAASEHLHVTGESGTLRSVIIGYPDNFDLAHAEIINETQKLYYFGENRPDKGRLIHEMNQYVAQLEACGVKVYRPEPLAGVPDQLMTRDIGVVIGQTFVVTRMANISRKEEWRGLAQIFKLLPAGQIVHAPEGVVLEGGDVVVDKGYIFVGLSQRTNEAGVAWLTKQFPQYKVVAIPLKQVAEGENVLHLDCAFVPVGRNLALIYEAGLREIPAVLRELYEFIPVTRPEQDMLGTNVLSVSPTQVITRDTAVRLNNILRDHGLTVYPLPFNEAPKTGGSFRCCSLPLHRVDF